MHGTLTLHHSLKPAPAGFFLFPDLSFATNASEIPNRILFDKHLVHATGAATRLGLVHGDAWQGLRCVASYSELFATPMKNARQRKL